MENDDIADDEHLEADYLVIGAGATGMAFVDELVSQSKARVILVDRRAKPGGHWNDAYRFVALHQPASYYGVNSEKLETSDGDLASRAQILAYYERVLANWLATGRVRFFPLCEYAGGGRFASVATGRRYQVAVKRKTVDGTYMNITVPSTRAPEFTAADGITLVPINALARLDRPWARYVIIGAGKTGIDAVLFLLDRGVAPDRIIWIISNDAWLLNREFGTPEALGLEAPKQLRLIARAETAKDVFLQLEATGRLFRLDETRWPTKYRCATVSPEEFTQLRRIEHIVRLGRVVRIDADAIVLDRGSVPTDSDSLHVDCAADGLTRRPIRPVFADDVITPQPVFLCQPAMSAALIAAVELRYPDDAAKNLRCGPVQYPELPSQFFDAVRVSVINGIYWGPRMVFWLRRSRLFFGHHLSFLGLLYHVFVALRWRRRGLAKSEIFMEDVSVDG